MIAFLKGLVQDKIENSCWIDVNGVGYEVIMPVADLERLPPTGEPVTIYTWHLCREEEELLYGFLNPLDRGLFQLLLEVRGIGPKSALVVVSGFSRDQLEQVVGEQNADELARLPGIGRKTAERLLLELKDKIKTRRITPLAMRTAEREEYSQAMEALQALGYSAPQARIALQKVLAEELPAREAGQDRVAALVRLALKHL